MKKIIAILLSITLNLNLFADTLGNNAVSNAACICTTEYNPVCSADNVTYSNACQANCANVASYSNGECQTNGTTTPDSDEPAGVAVSCDSCGEPIDPVCGINGQTYGNSCLASCNGVASFVPGSCTDGETSSSSSESNSTEPTLSSDGLGSVSDSSSSNSSSSSASQTGSTSTSSGTVSSGTGDDSSSSETSDSEGTKITADGPGNPKKNMLMSNITLMAIGLVVPLAVVTCPQTPSAWMAGASAALYVANEIGLISKYKKGSELKLEAYKDRDDMEKQIESLEEAAGHSRSAEKAANTKAKFANFAAMGFTMAAATAVAEGLFKFGAPDCAPASAAATTTAATTHASVSSAPVGIVGTKAAATTTAVHAGVSSKVAVGALVKAGAVNATATGAAAATAGAAASTGISLGTVGIAAGGVAVGATASSLMSKDKKDDQKDEEEKKEESKTNNPTEDADKVMHFSTQKWDTLTHNINHSDGDAFINFVEGFEFLNNQKQQSPSLDQYKQMKELNLFADAGSKAFLISTLEFMIPSSQASLASIGSLGLGALALMIPGVTGAVSGALTNPYGRAAIFGSFAALSKVAGGDMSKAADKFGERANSYQELADELKGSTVASAVVNADAQISMSCIQGGRLELEYDPECKCVETNTCKNSEIPNVGGYSGFDNLGTVEESIGGFGQVANDLFRGDIDSASARADELIKKQPTYERLEKALVDFANQKRVAAGKKPFDYDGFKSNFTDGLQTTIQNGINKLTDEEKEKLVNEIGKSDLLVSNASALNLGGGSQSTKTANPSDLGFNFAFDEKQKAKVNDILEEIDTKIDQDFSKMDPGIVKDRTSDLFDALDRAYGKRRGGNVEEGE